jgi:hypothetical protein
VTLASVSSLLPEVLAAVFAGLSELPGCLALLRLVVEAFWEESVLALTELPFGPFPASISFT